MNIASVMGVSTANALEAIYGENAKKRQDTLLAVPSWSGDSVRISEAARTLALMGGDPESENKADGEASGASKQGAASEFQEYAAVASARRAALRNSAVSALAALNVNSAVVGNESSAPAGVSRNSAGSISQMQSKLKELQEKLVEAQNSNLPEQAKAAMINSITAQIGQLVEEINELSLQV